MSLITKSRFEKFNSTYMMSTKECISVKLK